MAANATRPPAEPDRAIGHEVLAAVLRVRDGALQVLLWQRALPPAVGRWALPGGRLGEEDVATAVRRHLAAKVDVAQLSHLEQLAVFSDPHRVPGRRVVATAFLGLVPGDADFAVPDDTRWHAADRLPEMAFDHGAITGYGRDRLRAKLCYTNLGFALAPAEFTLSGLRAIYSAALGYRVSATNMHRVFTRRGVLVPTGTAVPSGRAGGRPAALFRFAEHELRVTDPFAVLRPPGILSRRG